MDCFVGFDTSNYTTSAAVCSLDGEVIANIKAPLPVKDGACGLRQSDAVFAHIKNIPAVTAQLREAIAPHRVLAVGCSARPRDAQDSYMPCFLSGVAAAHSFASALGVPLYDFSHQSGHVMAAIYSAGVSSEMMQQRFAAFHVSGGTTEMLLIDPRKDGFDVELVGGTEDLNAGQAIDRIGVMMGLSFPCGKEIERLAEENERKLPRSRVSVREGRCNLSGLQNIAERLWAETADPAAVSAYTLAFIGDTLCEMTRQLDASFGELPIIYAGGVMSNLYLQKRLAERRNTYFALPQYSADNAAGVSLLCRLKYLSAD